MRHTRFSRACCITALFVGICFPAHGQDRPESDHAGHSAPTLTYNPADLPALIRAAKDAGISLDYSNSTTTERAGADGASGESKGDTAKLGIDGTAPSVTLRNGAGGVGGSVKGTGSAENFEFPWIKIVLILAGAGCIVGSFIKGTRPPVEIDTAIALGASGATLIVIAFFPGLLLLLIPAALVIAIPHFLPDKAKKAMEEKAAKEKARLESALAAVVAGVHFAPSDASEKVKAEIAKQADPTDTDTIKSIKRNTLPT